MSLNSHEVHKGLHIGNIKSQLIGKRAILSCLDENPRHGGVFHKHINALDDPEFQLIKYFDQAADFIQTHISKGDVLVHCYAGISRSATLVIAYLIKYEGMSLHSALRQIQGKRPQVNPNPGIFILYFFFIFKKQIGFLQQLKEFELRYRNIKSYLNSQSLNTVSVNTPTPRYKKSFLFKSIY